MHGPIVFEWTDDGTMKPLGRFARACDKAFAVGALYPLVVAEQRSVTSHRHYFASLHEAWLNLPEDIAERFPSDEHLRKYALVKAGYADERSIVCGSKAEAQRIAAFIKPMDSFAVVVVKEATVKVFTPQSQSTKAMGAKTFQASKEAVLGIVAELVGVTPQAIERERAA